MTNPKVAICIKDGMVSYVAANQPVECVIVDYDIQNTLIAKPIPGSESDHGGEARAWVQTFETEVDPDWVGQIHNLIEKEY